MILTLNPLNGSDKTTENEATRVLIHGDEHSRCKRAGGWFSFCRLTIDAECQLKLNNFPMDEHSCPLEFSSCKSSHMLSLPHRLYHSVCHTLTQPHAFTPTHAHTRAHTHRLRFRSLLRHNCFHREQAPHGDKDSVQSMHAVPSASPPVLITTGKTTVRIT